MTADAVLPCNWRRRTIPGDEIPSRSDAAHLGGTSLRPRQAAHRGRVRESFRMWPLARRTIRRGRHPLSRRPAGRNRRPGRDSSGRSRPRAGRRVGVEVQDRPNKHAGRRTLARETRPLRPPEGRRATLRRIARHDEIAVGIALMASVGVGTGWVAGKSAR